MGPTPVLAWKLISKALGFSDTVAMVAYIEIQRMGSENFETARQSTAVWERTPTGKVVWRHVHETWVEGKVPTSSKA